MTKARTRAERNVSPDDYLVQLAEAILALRNSAKSIPVKDQEVMGAAAERIQTLERDMARCPARTSQGALVKLGVLSERLGQSGELALVSSLMKDIKRLAKG